jgi:hypothetical protein
MAAEAATQLKAPQVDPVPESPFYIPMTAPAARPRAVAEARRQFGADGRSHQSGVVQGGPIVLQKDMLHIVRTISSASFKTEVTTI